MTFYTNTVKQSIQCLTDKLTECGYAQDCIEKGATFPFERRVLDISIAYCHKPADVRSAAISIVTSPATTERGDILKTIRPFGAPLSFVVIDDTIEVWQQTTSEPRCLETLAQGQIDHYFAKNGQKLSPEAMYRAKNAAYAEVSARQLEFVDVGLLPFIERDIGESLSVKFMAWVGDARPKWNDVLKNSLDELEASNLLLHSVFRLLAAKILHDKQVPKFKRFEGVPILKILDRVVEHCGSTLSDTINTRAAIEILEQIYQQISSLATLKHISTESLGVIYEKAFISKETRRYFGTHSTPPWLADYLLWQVEDWFKELQPESRQIYEPACGHGAFLVAALRMLQQFSFREKRDRVDTAKYVRRMLHGAEIDSFALEIARLSLSLTDVPNPDGWKLDRCDLFETNPLASEKLSPGLVLTNPPYEKFTPEERLQYDTKYHHKYAQIIADTLPHISKNGIIGIVAPRSFLTINNTTVKALRKNLIENFEIREITALPDKIFTFSESETCVLLARRKERHTRSRTQFNYIDKKDIEEFRDRGIASYSQAVSLADTAPTSGFTLAVPRLAPIWQTLAQNPKLKDIADVGRGIEFKKGRMEVPGGKIAHKILQRVDSTVLHHERPRYEQLAFSDDDVQHWRWSRIPGIPQVIVNAARASRGPWAIWAVIDSEGAYFSTNLIAVRPKSEAPSLAVIWAILTSPLANAYIYAKYDKRHINTEVYRTLPIPHQLRGNCKSIEHAAQIYLNAARELRDGEALSKTSSSRLKALRLQIDAEVLRLYDLSPRDERALLDLFAGHERKGVPFRQTKYFPVDFRPFIPLHEYLDPAFKKTTAGELGKIDFEKETTPRMKEALRRAVELYSE